MLSYVNIKETLFDLINEEADRPFSDINDGCRLEEDLHMDSLNLAFLQIKIEDTFQFEFDPINDDFEECFNSFGSLCQYIAKKCGVEQSGKEDR